VSLLTTVLGLVAVALSLLAVFGHQWVTLVPGLGIGVLYRNRRIRVVLAVVSIGLAWAGFVLAPSGLQGALFVLVLLLTPLSGFLHAGRLFVPLDDPEHAPAGESDLPADAPVVGVEVDGHAHAWTVETLVPHHVVNDEVCGRPVAAAWCAYCNSGVVYDATVDGQGLTFVPLAVFRRNMVMRDRETGTIWQHATGEALIGPLSGTELEVLGGQLTTWGAWRDDHPGTTVAAEPEAWDGLLSRSRTRRLAEGTERVALPGQTEVDRRLPFTEDVVGVEVGGEAKAYPVAALRERSTIGDFLGGAPITVAYDPETDGARVFSGGESVPFQRTRWMGWFEFHPETEIYEDPGR